MAHYVFLVSWTAEGIREIAKSPARGDALHRAVDAAGGKMLAFLHTMGVYDAVAVVELPSDEAANTLALRAGRDGFVRTTTLKGWTPAEFASLVGKL